MASAITLEGIDQVISNLRYKNKNTLKHRFVGHIRQYYTKGDSLESLSEVDHAELIKILWDTDDSLEAIKNKRKNLNGVRSSVNADFKKLYEKGENPEGLKIGSSNIFVMSEYAKDKILKKLAYDLQPDGTLKLDQIMDILELANETVSGSIAVEDTEKKDGLKKIDQLKDLIKGLSEKVGLGSPKLSKAAPEAGDMAGKGDEQGTGSMGMDEVFEDSEIDTVDAVEDIEDLEEVAEDDILEDIEEDIENVEVDEIVDTDTDDLVEVAEIDEDLEDVLDEEDTELDYVEDVDDLQEKLSDDISKEQAGESGPGYEETLEGDGKKEDEQLGLPVGSLGQEYSIEADSKIKKNKLLAEEFDGYLGSMDRYYNHYILIPEGEYLIGSKQTKKDEKPKQIVFLEPFYFSRFPITNGLFEIFVEKTGYKTTAEKVGYGTVYFGRFKKKKDAITGLITSTWNSSLYCKTVEGACWHQPSGPKSTLYNKRNHPVVQISIEDAIAFAAWTGKRLPTENEWEAAARTANGRKFPWGQEWKKDACNIEDSCTADTTPVDKYVEFENDFGIVDTLGNVLEWTDNSFEEMSKTNNGEKYRAVKGGSWISGNDIRLFSRIMIESESHSNILGFRCVAY